MVDSPKPRSSAQSSRSSSVSKPNRKARRAAKAKEQREKQEEFSEPTAVEVPPVAGPSTPTKAQEVANETSTSLGTEEFIPFTFSDDEKDAEVEVEEEAFPVREWDKGKGKSRDYGAPGQKRKHDDIDFNDGYANKKQRTDAASRRAPWAVDVDWENCNNVAEMYVCVRASYTRLPMLTISNRLHKEVEAFVKYISPTPVEDEIRSLIVESVSRAVTETFPDAKVRAFGSYETKLYLPLG